MARSMSRATKVTVGAAALAVTVGAGITVAQTSNAASGQLTLSASGTVGTMNLGVSAQSGGNLPQMIADSTFGIRVKGATGSFQLSIDDYTPFPDVDPGILPEWAGLYVVQTPATASHVPSTGWSALFRRTDGDTSSDAAHPSYTDRLVASSASVHFAAVLPGEYKIHFTDPGEEAGTDDDVVSPTVTLRVYDVARVTASATQDDLKPSVTITPSTVAFGGTATAKIDMSKLKLIDSRGSSGGIGVLNTALARIVGVRFASADTSDALQANLTRPGVAPYSYAFTGVEPVTAAGTRVLPAMYEGRNVLRSVGALRAYGYVDIRGDGFGPSDQVASVGSATVVKRVAKPAAAITAFAVKSLGGGRIHITAAGTPGQWTFAINGETLTVVNGSAPDVYKVVKPGTYRVSATLTPTGYVPTSRTISVTVK